MCGFILSDSCEHFIIFYLYDSSRHAISWWGYAARLPVQLCLNDIGPTLKLLLTAASRSIALMHWYRDSSFLRGRSADSTRIAQAIDPPLDWNSKVKQCSLLFNKCSILLFSWICPLRPLYIGSIRKFPAFRAGEKPKVFRTLAIGRLCRVSWTKHSDAPGLCSHPTCVTGSDIKVDDRHPP